jgi:hypothetical protein
VICGPIVSKGSGCRLEMHMLLCDCIESSIRRSITCGVRFPDRDRERLRPAEAISQQLQRCAATRILQSLMGLQSSKTGGVWPGV